MTSSHSQAITKLQVLFLITLLIVASASVLYVNIPVESTPEPPEPPPEENEEEPELDDFLVYNLTISPVETGLRDPVTISVEVLNQGEEMGNYTVILQINDANRTNQTVTLLQGEKTGVEFTVSETMTGNYTVKIGTLVGAYLITVTPPDFTPPSGDGGGNSELYGLSLSQKEVWPGQAITISINVKNLESETKSFTVDLKINGKIEDTQTIELSPGRSTVLIFNHAERNLGTYVVEIGGNVEQYYIVQNNMHTLKVSVNGNANVDFKIDGVQYTTPKEILLPAGSHTIEMPPTDPTGVYVFYDWDDKKRNLVRTVSLYDRIELSAFYSGGSSCPSLYVWNGNDYEYVAEISNHGWLGYIQSTTTVEGEREFIFWRNDPWDFLKLDANKLTAKDGSYELLLTQRWNEIFYLDAAYMLVVDHPSDVEVYSTGVEQYLDPAFMGQIYTVSKNPLTPVSAINEEGEDVLYMLSMVDGVFTPGINGLLSPSWNNISWNTLTLDLGDLSDSYQMKLVINGKVDWGSADDYNTWLELFYDPSVPDGAQVTPPPYMEVKDADGNWVSVPEGRQFPIPPDVNPRTWVVDLTGLFPTDDYSLRINNFWNVTFDYIGIDVSSQSDVTIQRIDPMAELYQVFESYSLSSGNFTRYGDVTDLLFSDDDEFVIGRQGDEVSLSFSLDDIAPLEKGMERAFFLFVADWFKDEYGNWGFGFGFTVDPLPFLEMSGFPYPQTESYPYDEHLDYFLEYNTREITSP